MELVLTVLAFLQILSMALSVHVLFKRHESLDTSRYRFLQICAIAHWVGYLFLLYQISATQVVLMATVTLTSVSLVIFWIAFFQIRRRPFTIIFSKDNPERIETQGLYRWIRHPFYTSYILFYSGSILVTQNVWIGLLAATLIIVYLDAARKEEEKFKLGSLANEYSAYQRRTGRFFPRLVHRK
jgi:protein-S-isoprenylcysteine O-methyltransferase Ste14